MIIQLLKNKRVLCLLLVFFSLIYTFSVYMSEIIVKQEQTSENISADFSISECIYASGLSTIGALGARINHKCVTVGRCYNSTIVPIQISKFTSNGIMKYSLIKLPFYSIICALLKLKVIIYIFSSDGKKRIRI